MALPILETPMHSCVLPSSNERIDFRPFLVGEQKLLMIAQESDDQNTQIREMIRLINACCNDVNANQLPTVDLEYLFIFRKYPSSEILLWMNKKYFWIISKFISIIDLVLINKSILIFSSNLIHGGRIKISFSKNSLAERILFFL